MNKITSTFSKNLEKYVWINSVLERVTLKVSEYIFYRTPPGK